MAWTRRRFLRDVAVAAAVVGVRGRAESRSLRSVALAHGASTFAYGQHLVAREKQFFEEEGLHVPAFVVAGGGARVVRSVSSGAAAFGLGDSSHPLKAIERGRDMVMILATDTRCSYANVVVRRDLYDRGVTSLEALADVRRVGRKAIVAATAVGAGTHVYGAYLLTRTPAADGTPVNDHVEWVGGGASQTMLGGLKIGKFDAIMAVPAWRWAAESAGFGRAIYDVLDDTAWARIFGGAIPVTVGYVLRDTVERSADVVQAYVNATYRAQQWIRAATDDDIVDLLRAPYMAASPREDLLRAVRYYRTIFDWDCLIRDTDYANGTRVWVPTALDRPIPYARAVDMSFVRRAQASYKLPA